MVIAYPVSERPDIAKARFAQVLQTAHALAEGGSEVHLLLGQTGSIDSLLHSWNLEPLPTLRVRELPVLRRDRSIFKMSWNAVYHVSCLSNLLLLRRQGRVDAVYVRHPKLAAFLLRFRALLGLPIVYEAHELFSLATPHRRKVRMVRQLEQWVFDKADGIVSITSALARVIREEFQARSPTVVVPSGVALDRFRPNEWQGGRTICYVGQLHPWKGVGVVIRAMRYLPGESAVIVGGRDDAVETLQTLAEAEGCRDRLRFTGQVPPTQVPEYLKRAGVAVVPGSRTSRSAFFTSPLKLFEYMAAGVPIVAADLPSLREVLTHGETALLVPPEDPAALAEAISTILGDRKLALRLRRQALELVKQYSWQARARRLIAALERLVYDRSGEPRLVPTS